MREDRMNEHQASKGQEGRDRGEAASQRPTGGGAGPLGGEARRAWDSARGSPSPSPGVWVQHARPLAWALPFMLDVSIVPR